MAVLTNYALNNKKFCEIVGTKQITINIGNTPRTLNNTNELLGNVSGVYGVKTGFTGNAGRCLITSCKRDDLDIIVVVLGADTKNIRGLDTKKVIEYVFNNFEMIDTSDIVEEAFKNYSKNLNIKLKKSNSKIEIKYEDNFNYVYPINKNEVSNLKTSIYCVSVISSPLEAGKIIGKMRLISGKEILYNIDIKLKEKIEEKQWKDYFLEFIFNYKNYFKI